jgi:hypothetical protein
VDPPHPAPQRGQGVGGGGGAGAEPGHRRLPHPHPRASKAQGQCVRPFAGSLPKIPSFFSVLLILLIPYCSVSALVLLNIPFHANLRFESIGILFFVPHFGPINGDQSVTLKECLFLVETECQSAIVDRNREEEVYIDPSI